MTPNGHVEARVRSIIADVVRQDARALTRDADLVEALGVDSLQGLQILAGVEKHFAVTLPDEELIELRTIGRIADAVERERQGGQS